MLTLICRLEADQNDIDLMLDKYLSYTLDIELACSILGQNLVCEANHPAAIGLA